MVSVHTASDYILHPGVSGEYRKLSFECKKLSGEYGILSGECTKLSV